MRTIAIALLALALPTAAHAQFRQQPMPASGSRTPPPIDGRATTVRTPIDIERDRRDIVQPRDGYTTPPIDGRVSPGALTVNRELDRARRDIERRRDNGELSRSEAKRLRREVRRIDAMADRYRSDGLTEFERRELELRTSELRNRTATGRAF